MSYNSTAILSVKDIRITLKINCQWIKTECNLLNLFQLNAQTVLNTNFQQNLVLYNDTETLADNFYGRKNGCVNNTVM